MRDRPGEGGAPGAWQVARRWSAGRRTTRRNGSPAGSPGGTVGKELARSCSSPPLRGATPVFIPTRIETRLVAVLRVPSTLLNSHPGYQDPSPWLQRRSKQLWGPLADRVTATGKNNVPSKYRKVRPHRPQRL